MRTAIVWALGLAVSSTAWADPAGKVRVAVVHPEPLLASEQKALAELQKKLGKRKLGTIELGDASPAEVAYTGTGDLPPEWKDATAIVVLHIQPPTGPKTRLVTSGIGTLVVHDKAGQAIYSEEVDGTAATSLRAENLDRWIAGAALLAARAGGAQ